MIETRYATMERNPKLPLSAADSKPKLLRKLQGTIHFEKTLTAISSANGHAKIYKLGLPAWFVHKYGDKFGKSVILRTEWSRKSWPVKLTVSFPSPSGAQVVFSGGWKPFATSHGLQEGDSLVFSLTATSEFEVYIFPGAGNSKRWHCPYQVQKNWSYGFELNSRKQAKQLYECRVNEQFAAEGSIEGTVKINGLISKKKAVGEDVSASGHSSRFCSLSSSSNDLQLIESENVLISSSRGHHDSNKGQEPTLDGDELMVSSVTSEKKFNVPDIEYQDLTLQIMVNRNLSELPVFSKKLVAINIYRHDKGGKTACMEIPVDFCKTYGKRLHSLVKLQGIRDESEVRAVACLPSQNSGKQPRLNLRAGWREFTYENNLEVGQELLFALAADSFFVVRVVPPSREITGQDRA